MLVNYFISILSVFLFCGCCYALIQSATAQLPIFNRDIYSKSAQRIAKGYKVAAWAVMSGFFLLTLISSFAQIFIEI